MADSNSQGKNKQKNDQGGKRRPRVEYKRCHVCGARKKAEDMFSDYKCYDCFNKNLYHGEGKPKPKNTKLDDIFKR